ncbi:MAG: YncE family protein [Sphingobacteriia bacterium]|nr:YncE family protein [Sphingobacteriia bacterium]
MKKNLFLGAVTAFVTVSSFAQSGYKLTKTFHVASGGGWDYITVNPQSNKLYLSHGTQVNIVDKNTGDSLGVVSNTTGVHGIAFINELNKGYTSNGRINNVTVFDLKTNAAITQIATGENPDAIFYEPFSKTIITCNGRSKDLTIIDAATDKVVATIPVGGKPETAVSDEAGKVFVNIEDKNEIVVIDIKTKSVVAHWALGDAEGPTGLAIDVKTKRLFAGCEKKLVVVDAANGKVVTTVAIGDGCDGVAFDSNTKTIFTSNGAAATMSVIKEVSKEKFELVENVNSKKGARTICVDESTHKVYMPTADFEPQAAGEKGRPKMIPGSFQVIVFEK